MMNQVASNQVASNQVASNQVASNQGGLAVVPEAALCCPPIAVQSLGKDQAEAIAPLFKALGDPVRLRLMSMIASTDEACVCDLTEGFEVSGPTISHHLRVLREAGLVEHERRGTWVYYWVRPEVLRQLGELLAVVPAVRNG